MISTLLVDQCGSVAHVVQVRGAEAAVAQTERELGSITQVVNSAGIAGPNMPIEDYPLDDWNAIVAEKPPGSFHLPRAVFSGVKAPGVGGGVRGGAGDL